MTLLSVPENATDVTERCSARSHNVLRAKLQFPCNGTVIQKQSVNGLEVFLPEHTYSHVRIILTGINCGLLMKQTLHRASFKSCIWTD